MPYPIADRWRARHRKRGERYRWLKAFRCSCANPQTNEFSRNCPLCEKGRRYVEQTMGSEVRALVHGTTLAMDDEEFGVMPVGETQISVMPDESYLMRMDKVILPDRYLPERVVLKRGAGATDALPKSPVVAIVDVTKDATNYAAGVDYQRTGNAIEWIGSAPSAGSNYAVEFTYNPTYIFLGSSQQVPRPDKFGVLMPLRGVLTMRNLEN